MKVIMLQKCLIWHCRKCAKSASFKHISCHFYLGLIGDLTKFL